ncbi:MAG: N-6 DNA methylase [Rhodothermaceae bacterium]|nr:N-6 DNA methylase [Rhodothermaceae bacterium]MYJ21607.1 N-6 DNA methylase [Rhodothermaceae bacterium]
MVSDGCVWKVLESLVVLDGERLSYRTLDVEQIGSVYEAIMGFRVELSTGCSIGIRSQKRTGAAVIVDLDSLLDVASGQRVKQLQDQTDRKLTGRADSEFRKASTSDDLVVALERVIDRDATPAVISPGTPILQPTDERRRSGSHYTPRSLTEPIVSEALRPVLERLGERAHPKEILNIKVLDPATGSGAFLVESCRQLAERLVESWSIHGGKPEQLVDEDELLHARRLVAQRCLYGVDRNPMAIDLAKLSLWLVTLARNHEFTFIDHALRHGDSLVGLSRRQIELFNWKVDPRKPQASLHSQEIDKACRKVSELRRLIQELGGEIPEDELQELMDEMDRELQRVRQIADLVLLAFFKGKKDQEGKENLARYADLILGRDENLSRAITDVTRQLPFDSFHWELEFPEVFDRNNPGFDTVVGNPPFAGQNTIAASNHIVYPKWLKELHTESHGNADLAAHFFRRAFNSLRKDGTLGLIATNTISQGDTRWTGLRWICEHEGEIYRAQRRYKWPGEAAVIVSVIHLIKGKYTGKMMLDNKSVDLITAFLFHGGRHENPNVLKKNSGKSFAGNSLLGMGFTFDDADKKGVTTPIANMECLIQDNPRNQEVIFPYIGGQEVNSSPVHAHHRYAINFHDWPLRRADLGMTWRDADKDRRKSWLRDGIVPLDYPDPVAADWPPLLSIVEEKVKPGRSHLTRNPIGRKRKKFWWQYGSLASELHAEINKLDLVLAISQTTSHIQFAFLSANQVFSNKLVVFPIPTFAAFCTLQSRPHEIWARFFGSSLKDDPCYTPTDCFETFPFPVDWESLPSLEAVGETYYTFRAELMVKNNEGMTKTYNRFHDPNEHDPQIRKLRELHAAMDRAVLDAYGWTDIPTDCEFLLDYEIDEETWGKKKKPYRYRWPDEIHDEVLARLLDLNAKRYEEELVSGTK